MSDFDEKDLHAVLMTLIEESMNTACKYAKSAGRNNVSATDMEYALKYQAHEYMKTPGLAEKVENTYQKLSESESESEWETASEQDEEGDDPETFTRSTSDDPEIVKVNAYHDAWGEWNPESLVETLLKRAVDKACKIE